MTLPPVPRQPLRDSLCGAESPLDIAMRREQEAKLARKRSRGAVMEAILTEGPPTLQKAVMTSPEVARQWTNALEEPVQRAVANAFHEQPQRMAALVAPALSGAFRMESQRARRQWTLGVGRFLSGLSHARVWRWVVEALWEGDSVVDYVERRAGAWEVVELFLHDPSGHRLLCMVRKPGVDSILRPRTEAPSEGNTQDGVHYSFVGSRCRLAARVMGTVTPAVKQQLQALCVELDALLEDTCLDTEERAKLLPLRMRAGLYSEGPLTVQHAARRTVVTLFVALVGMMAVFLWAGCQEYRWQIFLDVLSREPGIQVTHFERGWGRASVQGIRSPEARDPVVLATSLGLDVETLDLNFKTSPFPAGSMANSAKTRPLEESTVEARALTEASAAP